MKKYRYFWGFLELEKRWLNKMARKGWRLKKVNCHNYEFIKSTEKFNYDVDILWDKSIDEINKYIDFLHEMGHRTFRDSLNLNFSIARIKYRAGRSILGHFDTNKGNLNRELLIVEKENEISLYTLNNDLYKYYKNRRNMYLFPALLGSIVMLDTYSIKFLFEVHNGFGFVFVLCITLFFLMFLIYFQGKMYFMKHKGKIEEK